MKISLSEVIANKDLATYFNFTANVLLPIHHGAADRHMKIHRETIVKVAQHFLTMLNYSPEPIYRGVILREPAACIMPDRFMQYLSFSTDIEIAKHFANVNGFGSDIIDVAKQLGTYGYVIEYTPTMKEVLFHYDLLEILPYAEAFNLIGLDGSKEVSGLKKQKEIMIAQPVAPLVNIRSLESFKQTSFTY